MAVRITTYQQAFDGVLGIPFDEKLQRFVKELEKEGHTEKSICFTIWKKQDKLRAFKRDSRFMSILKNEINKWSWKKNDPRWKEYWAKKEEEKRAETLRAELEKIKIEESLTDEILANANRKRGRRKPSGFIYFIQGQCGGAIKIGYSKKPELRLKELQTGYPDTLRILLMVPGNETDEAAFHTMFADFRLKGEWFKPDPYIVNKLKEIAAKIQQGGGSK
jgi:hypothetical protein